MRRLLVFVILPAAAICGLLGDVDQGIVLVLLACSCIALAVELLFNQSGGSTKKQVKQQSGHSCLLFWLTSLVLLTIQAAVVLVHHTVQLGTPGEHHEAPPVSAQEKAVASRPPQKSLEIPTGREEAQPPPPPQALAASASAPSVAVERVPPRPASPGLKVKGRTQSSSGSWSESDGGTLPPLDLSLPFGGTLPYTSKEMRTVSLVFPCAEERSNALNTVDRFCERTPEDVLEEIIVVDDGSKPPLQELFQKDSRRLDINPRCKVKFLRHEETIGLMAAKLTGGKAALGDVIAFFDCHCSPNVGWHKEILQQISANPRRMVVPAITDLDLDIFDESKDSQVNAKCYLTFDCDFKWFDDDSDFIPTISGGLVVMGREWFNMTGGFDEEMHGWGGENLDQSLRAWLCGGEITRAKSSRVAHMWRTRDPRTATRYHVRAKGTNNRGRVAAAWFDAFSAVYRGSKVPASSVSNYDHVKKRLHCRPLSYFLYRFRRVYVGGGIMATQAFRIRDKESGLCLTKAGKGEVCDAKEHGRSHVFQLGNVDKSTGKCCSGIRAYQSNDCWDLFDRSGIHWYSCDISGSNGNQQYAWTPDGWIVKGLDGECLFLRDKKLAKKDCGDLKDGEGVWEKANVIEPTEYRIYREEVARHRYEALLPDLPDN